MARFRSSAVALSVIALILGMAGCDKVAETLDPCAGERACEVDGVDVIVDKASLDANVVPEINKPAVPVGGTVEVSYTLLNRGKERSEATSLQVCLGDCVYNDPVRKSVDIPALKPGETVSGTVKLVLPDDQYGDWSVQLEVYDKSRNKKDLSLLIERPNLLATLSLLAEEAQVGTDVKAVVTVKNQAYVAGAPKSTSRVCLQGYSYYTPTCYEQFAFVDVETRALQAGATQVDTIAYPLAVSALDYPDRVLEHKLMVCGDVHGSTGGEQSCVDKPFTTLPNFDLACNVGDIVPGQTHSGTITAAKCDLYVADKVEMVKFTAPANTSYAVDLTDLASSISGDRASVYILTPRGAVIAEEISLYEGDTFTFTIGQAGTYYLAITSWYGAYGQTYTIHFTQP